MAQRQRHKDRQANPEALSGVKPLPKGAPGSTADTSPFAQEQPPGQAVADSGDFTPLPGYNHMVVQPTSTMSFRLRKDYRARITEELDLLMEQDPHSPTLTRTNMLHAGVRMFIEELAKARQAGDTERTMELRTLLRDM